MADIAWLQQKWCALVSPAAAVCNLLTAQDYKAHPTSLVGYPPSLFKVRQGRLPSRTKRPRLVLARADAASAITSSPVCPFAARWARYRSQRCSVSVPLAPLRSVPTKATSGDGRPSGFYCTFSYVAASPGAHGARSSRRCRAHSVVRGVLRAVCWRDKESSLLP